MYAHSPIHKRLRDYRHTHITQSLDTDQRATGFSARGRYSSPAPSRRAARAADSIFAVFAVFLYLICSPVAPVALFLRAHGLFTWPFHVAIESPIASPTRVAPRGPPRASRALRQMY
jgi:hypothetical protein